MAHTIWLIPGRRFPVAEVLTLDAVVMGDDFACDCVCGVCAVGCPLTSHQPCAKCCIEANGPGSTAWFALIEAAVCIKL